MARKAEQEPSEKKRPIAAVGGIIYRYSDDGSVELLLIRKRDGYWTLPKGKIKRKRGESEADALVREVAEEVGLGGEVGQKVCTVEYTTPKRKPPRRKIVTYYLFRAADGVPRPDEREDIAEVRWVSVPEALQSIHRDRVRQVVQEAAELLRDPQPDSQPRTA